MPAPLTDDVRAALEGAQIEGDTLRIATKLTRKTYLAVNRVLENLGGKWTPKARGHVFPSDPGPRVAGVLETGQAPGDPRRDDGFFATPPEIAAYVVGAHSRVPGLSVDDVVLEPSAGAGALVHAIRVHNSQVTVVAVEPDRGRAVQIRGAMVFQATFEDFHTEYLEKAARFTGLAGYQAIVMNPPFTLPGRPRAWIDHVDLARRLLRPDGELTAIVPAGILFRQDRFHQAVRVAATSIEKLPEEAFRGSGTSVATCVVRMGPGATINNGKNASDPL